MIFRYGCIALQSSWNIALSGPIPPPPLFCKIYGTGIKVVIQVCSFSDPRKPTARGVLH